MSQVFHRGLHILREDVDCAGDVEVRPGAVVMLWGSFGCRGTLTCNGLITTRLSWWQRLCLRMAGL